MAVTVGTLTIDLKANTASFSGAMDKMSHLSAKTASDVSRSLQKIAAAGIAMAAAVAGATAGLVMHALDAADSMGKLAQATGTTTETLSVLAYAASLSNVSTEDLGKGLTKLAKASFGAQNGNKELSRIFDRLGVSVVDSTGHLKDSGLLMEEVSVKFAKMGDSSGKTALAMQVFGKSGAGLIPLLNQYGSAQEQVNDEAKRFGLILSTETANAAAEAHDNLDRLTAMAKGFGNTLLNSVMPEVSDLITKLLDLGKKADIPGLAQSFGTHVVTAIRSVGDAIEFVTQHAEALKNVLITIAGIQLVKFAVPLLADAAATGSLTTGVALLTTKFLGLGKVIPILMGVGKWIAAAIPLLFEAGGAAYVFEGALAAIGGPVTLVIGGVALLAAGIYAFRDSTFTAGGEVYKLRDALNALSTAFMASVKASFAFHWGDSKSGNSAYTDALKQAKTDREKADADELAARNKKAAAPPLKLPPPDTKGLGKPEKDIFGDELRKLDQSIAAQKEYISALGATPDKIQAVASAERAKALIVEMSNKLIDAGRLKEGELLSASQQNAIMGRVAQEDRLKATQEYGKSLVQQQHEAELSLQQTTALSAATLLGDAAVRHATVDNVLLGLSYQKSGAELEQFLKRLPALRDAMVKSADAQALTQYHAELSNLLRTSTLATDQARIMAAANLQGNAAVRQATIDTALLGQTYNKSTEEIKAMEGPLKALRAEMALKAKVDVIAGANSEVFALGQEIAALRLVTSAMLGTVEAQRQADLAAKLYSLNVQIAALAAGAEKDALLKKRDAIISLTQAQNEQADLQAGLTLRSPLELYEQEIQALDRAAAALAKAQGGTLTYGQSLEVAGHAQDAFNKLTDAQIEKMLRFGTARDGMKAFFLEMSRSAESAASIIYTALNSAFDKVSQNLTDLITTGKANFGQMLQDIGKQMLNSVIRVGIQKGVGAIAAKLGLGAALKRDGSDVAHALYVQDVSTAGSALGKGDSQLDNSASSILSMLQKHDVDPTGAMDVPFYVNVLNFPAPQTPSATGGIVSSLISGAMAALGAGGLGATIAKSIPLFGNANNSRITSYGEPGDAIGIRGSGGNVSPSNAYIVGDQGPELLLKASGSIMSNSASRRVMSGGGGNHYNFSVDARGTDPILTEQRTRAGILAAHNSAVVTGLQLRDEQLKRTPQR